MSQEPVDARGLSCPQPVMLARKAMQESDSGEVALLVDTMTNVHNCTRAAESIGWQVSYEETDDGCFKLTFHK